MAHHAEDMVCLVGSALLLWSLCVRDEREICERTWSACGTCRMCVARSSGRIGCSHETPFCELLVNKWGRDNTCSLRH